MSKAILEMGAGLSRSIEMLSQGFNQGYPQHRPVNQNLYVLPEPKSAHKNPHVYKPMPDVSRAPPTSTW